MILFPSVDLDESLRTSSDQPNAFVPVLPRYIFAKWSGIFEEQRI